MLNVMLVDDQHLFREGVKALIRETADMQVTLTADNSETALDSLEAAHQNQHQNTPAMPDVILIDHHLPALNGIWAITQIKERYPEITLIMLTSYTHEERVIRAISAGADGFLYKDLHQDEFLNAIRDAALSGKVIAGEAARILIKWLHRLMMDDRQTLNTQLAKRGIHLTTRELDIASLLLDNTTNHTIAQELQLEASTVKNYISEVYSKLNIHKRQDAIHFLQQLL